MKIVQVAARFYPFIGGLENYCYGLSKKLVKIGHDVEVITSLLDKKLPLKEVKEGIKITRCPCLGDFFHVNPLTFIINKLKKAQPDIIHAHSYIFLTSNQVALNRKINGTPFILHLHGGIDSSTTANDISTRLNFFIKEKIYDPTLGKWTVKLANELASVSKLDIENARKIWDLDNKKIHWLPNAIDINSFNGQNCNDPLNVVFIGRLEPWKGVNIFVKVARKILEERDDVTFTIVGDGSLRNYVEKNCFNGRIKVLGRVSHNHIPEILSNASVLALPSYVEGLPTVCLEALASEVPVVASDVGGTSEIVIEKETGFLVPPGNTNIFVNRIMNLLDDENTRRKMGRNGRKLIEKYFSWDKVVEKTEEIYNKIRE